MSLQSLRSVKPEVMEELNMFIILPDLSLCYTVTWLKNMFHYFLNVVSDKSV